MNTTTYRHLLVARADGLNLEWIRVQTGCRSLTATLSLMIRIICTPEGLSFIKNHPMSPTHHKPRTAREMLIEMQEAKAANDREKVGAAVAARMLKDEN